MSDSFVIVPPSQDGSRIDNSPLRVNGLDVFRQRVEAYQADTVSIDASARQRVSQIHTLFDGKTLRAEDTLLWDTKGTGSTTFEDGAINKLSVTAGQYEIRQTKQYMPYFSGKSQQVEMTFDQFQAETGVTKRCGYFSSSAVAPYSANLDGCYLESSDQIYLVVANNGTEVLRKAITDWDGYSQLSSYDWSKFTVVMFDFLWLGGAILRLFVKVPDTGFVLAHTFHFSGAFSGIFMRSPNHPVRYEIRSTTGAGAFRSVCSQVGTEGALSNNSKSLVAWHQTLINANGVGTIYAVKGVKKRADFRDIPVELNQFGGSMTATADAGIWMLLLNPTLSAPLTYAQNTVIDEATATTQTVTNVGRVIGTIHINQAGASVPYSNNQLAFMNIGIDDTPDEYVLAYMPLTANQTINGALSLQVF